MAKPIVDMYLSETPTSDALVHVGVSEGDDAITMFNGGYEVKEAIEASGKGCMHLREFEDPGGNGVKVWWTVVLCSCGNHFCRSGRTISFVVLSHSTES